MLYTLYAIAIEVMKEGQGYLLGEFIPCVAIVFASIEKYHITEWDMQKENRVRLKMPIGIARSKSVARMIAGLTFPAKQRESLPQSLPPDYRASY